MPIFLRVFNAVQIVTLFSALPWIMSWLQAATFTGAVALFWLSILVYCALFFMHVGSLFSQMFD